MEPIHKYEVCPLIWANNYGRVCRRCNESHTKEKGFAECRQISSEGYRIVFEHKNCCSDSMELK